MLLTKKNILILIFFAFILSLGICGCKKDHTTTIALSPNDTCWNLFARDSNYRKGKWVQMLDSITIKYENPDTIWFISDSLMAWSFPCCNPGYLKSHVYFTHCNGIVCQSWDSVEQARNVWYYRSEYLNYEKRIVSIIFLNGQLGFDTISYIKIQ